MNYADWLKEYPFDQRIIDQLNNDRCLYDSLRLSNRDRFELIPNIITSSTPPSHKLTKDQVIGLWYEDKERQPKFRQDFIVRKGGSSGSIIAYVHPDYNICTHYSVKNINQFFTEYGSDGKYYHRKHQKPWMHHYDTIDELPDPIKQVYL